MCTFRTSPFGWPLCVICVGHLAIAVAVAVAVDVGAAAVVCLYFFMVSVANREATEIQATWVV